MEEQRACGKGLKQLHLYDWPHSIWLPHPTKTLEFPLGSIRLGLTLYLFFERQKTKVKKSNNKIAWVAIASLLCEFTSI